MKALFIGGTGLISSAVTALALERGWDLTLLNRGQHAHGIPAGAKVISADIQDDAAVRRAIEGQHYDVVAEWIAFKPERVARDIDLFEGRCGQYILISSAAAYERPQRSPYITESSSLNNRYWQYGRDKRMCEETALNRYRQTGFPVTIVRPSLTYGDTQIPFAMGSWGHPWSLVQRMLDGKEIVVHGDGTSLWTMTHNTDFAKGFVGLMGRRQAIGEAYHITSDEVLTWDEIAIAIGAAVGVEPKMVHCTAQQIARFLPGKEGDLLGDKSTSAIFDNSKIKRLVPDFVCTVPFHEGVRRSVAYFNAHPELKTIDQEWDRAIDALVEADRRFRP
jgi:nucleoside-diphosphate-sugar epimerase